MSGLGQKAPAFIFIFPLELLVVSRIVVAFAKLTQVELDLPSVCGNWVTPSSVFVLAYYGVFCSAILAWLGQ